MNTLNRIIRYKKMKSRIEIMQKMHFVRIRKVELSVTNNGSIEVTALLDDDTKDSFLCNEFTFSKLYEQLVDLV